MQYLILYVILIAICFFEFGLTVSPNEKTDILQIQKNANMLRGIFAIFIIYTHCTLAYSQLPILLMPLRKVSTFGVGFFFVLSGYGLALSTDKKNNYLDKFLQRKIPPILKTAIISRIISGVILYLYRGESFSVEKIITQMNWYIYAMIILYILFYLVYKFFKKSIYRVIGIWVLTFMFTILVLISVRLHVPLIGRSYYISEWAFPVGVTIYEGRNIINKLLSKYKYITFVFMFLFLIVTFGMALKADEYSFLDLISHNLMLIPFYYFIILLCKYIKFDNPILVFLNKISFEIYLYQFVILNILINGLNGYNTMFFISCVVLTIVLAWIVHSTGSLVGRKFK